MFSRRDVRLLWSTYSVSTIVTAAVQNALNRFARRHYCVIHSNTWNSGARYGVDRCNRKGCDWGYWDKPRYSGKLLCRTNLTSIPFGMNINSLAPRNPMDDMHFGLHWITTRYLLPFLYQDCRCTRSKAQLYPFAIVEH